MVVMPSQYSVSSCFVCTRSTPSTTARPVLRVASSGSTSESSSRWSRSVVDSSGRESESDGKSSWRKFGVASAGRLGSWPCTNSRSSGSFGNSAALTTPFKMVSVVRLQELLPAEL